MFLSFPHGKHCFQCHFLFSRCKLCREINENQSMRALAKILRARAREHSSNFCEQFEQRPNFESTFKWDGTIRYPSLPTETTRATEFKPQFVLVYWAFTVFSVCTEVFVVFYQGLAVYCFLRNCEFSHSTSCNGFLRHARFRRCNRTDGTRSNAIPTAIASPSLIEQNSPVLNYRLIKSKQKAKEE